MIDADKICGAAKQHATKHGYTNFVVHGCVKMFSNEYHLTVSYDQCPTKMQKWICIFKRGQMSWRY